MCWKTFKAQPKSLISFMVSLWPVIWTGSIRLHLSTYWHVWYFISRLFMNHSAWQGESFLCAFELSLSPGQQTDMMCSFRVCLCWPTLLCWFFAPRLSTAVGSNVTLRRPKRSSCKPGNLNFSGTWGCEIASSGCLLESQELIFLLQCQQDNWLQLFTLPWSCMLATFMCVLIIKSNNILRLFC